MNESHRRRDPAVHRLYCENNLPRPLPRRQRANVRASHSVALIPKSIMHALATQNQAPLNNDRQ